MYLWQEACQSVSSNSYTMAKTLEFPIRGSESKSWIGSEFQLLGRAPCPVPDRTPVLWSLPPRWETWAEFLAPSFSPSVSSSPAFDSREMTMHACWLSHSYLALTKDKGIMEKKVINPLEFLLKNSFPFQEGSIL